MRGTEGVELGARQARRGATPGTNQNFDRQVMQVIERVLSGRLNQLPIWQEKMEVLNADRPRAIARAAVRRSDLSGLNLTPESQEVDAVTVEAFNALVRDTHAIMHALSRINERLS